ncbi:hypothetical protein EDB85DRAFT_2140216 [Lactarius pseudohatsudake]|nr:hypothetical protein EDB85DRAFT_2140216 [Lactarius pseudohatsudake]
MPFQDLPHRREDSAPVLNLADPCEIWRYFDDLEFLFLKHRVSDNQEKKRAAVHYPSVAVERLWKTARAFGDPACSYEDFKAEVIALYPEAIAAQEHTLADLDMLVAHCARTAIRSEIELGAYYCEFLIISRFLIAKSRISAPTQACYLLASFEPRLATAIHARLERRFPDHLPDDPYDTEAIYDAALYVLAWQRTAPFVDPLRDILILFPSSLAPPAPLTSLPPTVHAFPLATESLSPIPSDPRTATHALKQERATSLVPVPRDAAPPFTASAETSKPIPTMPPPVQAFPPVLQFVQADAPATVPTFAPKCAAPLISAARDVLLPSASTLAPRAPVLPTPTPVNAFLTAPEPAQPTQPDATAATLDALAEAITSLKSGLEAILDAQKSPESRAPDPEAVQSRSERCKFCGSSTHLEEECEEADEYILAGMCKRNVFGRLTLPSGAEVPRRIKGKCLRKRFEEYHSQHPGQRAAPAYLEDLVRPQTPTLQDATSAIPSVMGATSPGAEATALAMSEVPRQPRSPERTLCDPRAASNRRRATEAPGDLRKAIVRSSNAPGVPKSAAQPVPGQSEPERDDTATSRARPWMRESNFAVMAASDRREAPLMVSQRGLFAFVPGIRPEAAHTAASTPAPPKECAVKSEALTASTSTSASGRSLRVYSAQRTRSITQRVRTIAQRARTIAQRARSITQHAHTIAQRARYQPSPLQHLQASMRHAKWQHPVQPSRSLAQRSQSQSKVGRDGRKVVSPTARQPASVKQSVTCHQSTALQLPFHTRKPPDVVPSMRDPSATLIQRPCNLRDSVRTYTLPTMHSYALAEDWGQSIFQSSPIHCASLTLSDALDSDATGAQTPAMHANSRSDVSGQRKCLQPVQQRAQVPQCNCDDRAICSRVARTLLRYRSKSLTAFISPAAPCMAAAAQEQRKRSRSSVPQAASSADTTASAPQSCGGSYVTHGRRMTARIDSSTFRFRGSVRGGMRGDSFKSNSQCEEDTNTRSSGSTICARTCASRQTIRDDCQHLQQHSRHPRQCARYLQIDLLKSGIHQEVHTYKSSSDSATCARTMRHSRQRLQPARRRVRAPRVDHNDHAIRRGSPYACRDISNRATFAQAPAPLPRRHARQQRHENNQEQPHQVASSADPTASAPQLRGGSHVAIKFQRTSRIDSSDFRFCGSVRGGTRRSSLKSNTQRSKESSARLQRRQQQRYVRADVDVYSNRSDVRDTSGPAATRVKSTARNTSSTRGTVDQHSDRTRRATTATAAARHTLQPHARAPSHLAQGFKTTPDVDSSALKSREHVRDKSDFALGEEHPLATYLKRKHISNSAAIAHPSATRLGVEDNPAARSERDSAQDISTITQGSLKSTRRSNCTTPAPNANPQQRARQPRLDAEVDILEQTAPRRGRPRLSAAARATQKTAEPRTATTQQLRPQYTLRLASHKPSGQNRHRAQLGDSKTCTADEEDSCDRHAHRIQATILIVEFSPPISDFRAQCSSPLAFLSVPHLRAALVTQARRVTDPGGHSYEVSRRADVCATVCDHSRSTDLVPSPDIAALARGSSPSTPTRPRPPRIRIRPLAPRGGLRDTSQRFTPPRPCATLTVSQRLGTV